MLRMYALVQEQEQEQELDHEQKNLCNASETIVTFCTTTNVNDTLSKLISLLKL